MHRRLLNSPIKDPSRARNKMMQRLPLPPSDRLGHFRYVTINRSFRRMSSKRCLRTEIILFKECLKPWLQTTTYNGLTHHRLRKSMRCPSSKRYSNPRRPVTLKKTSNDSWSVQRRMRHWSSISMHRRPWKRPEW